MIAIGCDHAGFELKQVIMTHLKDKGFEFEDFGCYSHESVHYPIYGKRSQRLLPPENTKKVYLSVGRASIFPLPQTK